MLVAPGVSAQRWKHCRAFSSRVSTQRSPLTEHPSEGEQVFHFPMLSSCRQWSIEPGPSLPTTGSGAGSAYPVACLFWTTTRGTKTPSRTFRWSSRSPQGHGNLLERGDRFAALAMTNGLSPCFVAPGAPPLLGAVASESLFLAIDPVAKRLVPVEGFVGHPILRSSACHCEA